MVGEHAIDDPLLGQDLAGKYRVVARLGAGGFGTVYSAINLSLATEVAIKVGRGPETDARMRREAQAAARLRSPYTVRVFDVGELVSGALFIVMELLPGRSLKEWLAAHGPLAVDVAARWIGQACMALHEAHAQGLVHRDLKPSNLFVVDGPTLETHLKLLDFGLVKSVEAPVGDATQSARMLGTPQYMSPEQVRGVELSHLSDVWSLGVVLYECLSGRLPFERDTTNGTLVAIASEPPRPLAEASSGLPAAVHDIVSRCLRKAPGDRFESVRTLAAALAPLASPGAQLSFPPAAGPHERADEEVTFDTRDLGATQRDASAPPLPRRTQNRVTALLVALFVLLFVYWLGRETSPPNRGGGEPSTATAPAPLDVPGETPRRYVEPPQPSEPVRPIDGPAASGGARTAPLSPAATASLAPAPLRTRPPPSAERVRAPGAPSSRLVLEPTF